jgi:hypothetical protein
MAKAARGTANLPVNYSEQLSKEAQEIGKRIQAGGGSKVRANGNRSFILPEGGEATEIEGVIVDFYSANMFYDRPFDKDQPAAPACFAMGEIPSTLAPPAEVPDRQADSCATCPNNQFGSADNGKGKACRNKRILAILPEDANDESEIITLEVPPGSVQKFDGYVAGLAAKHKTVPVGVVTKITLDQAQQYFSPRFDVVRPLQGEELAPFMTRREEARQLVSQPPDTSQYTPPAPKKGPGLGVRKR